MTDMKEPDVSGNIIYEDRMKAKQVFSYLLHQTQSTGPLTHMLEVKRGMYYYLFLSQTPSRYCSTDKCADCAAHSNNDMHVTDTVSCFYSL